MSTGEAAAIYGPAAEGRPIERSSLLTWAERLTPSQGWDSFALLVAAVGGAAVTVREAGWVETPGLMLIVFLSSLSGLVLAKAKGPWPLLFLAGLAFGFVVVVWLGLSLTEGQPLSDRLTEMWDRSRVWYDAAATGGISTDQLPLTIAVLALGWLLGYVSAWSLFKMTNVWIGLVLTGTATLTILSFLPGTYESRFLLFMLVSLLLVARVTAVQRDGQWRRARFGILNSSKWLAVPAAVGMSVAILGLASGLPLRVYISYTAANIWNQARSPIVGLEDEFARLFSGIPTRKDLSGRFFAKTLPFQGKISFGGDVVLRATSEYPSYWLSRTYSRYTSEGWVAGDTEKMRVGPNSRPPPAQESFKRAGVFQRLEPTFNTISVLSGGNVEWISREAVVETLSPLEFEIDLRDATGDVDFPEDIQTLAGELRSKLDPLPSIFVESYISGMLPLDLVLVGVSPDTGDEDRTSLDRVTLARKEPLLPDLVTWRFVDPLKANDSYSMRSHVSRATNDDLRAAGTQYSGFVKDHYLQLPATLPQRVRDRAQDVTRDAETPLDKALAVQDYLRGATFEYSHDIERPPRGADGVDYFLFETREGYSDYFASSMAVLLRAVGVPARQAAGYAPGELDETGRLAVKDSDSHGWTQVYFPGHGWLDFEPTSRWPAPDREGTEEIESELGGGAGLDPSDECFDEDPGLFESGPCVPSDDVAARRSALEDLLAGDDEAPEPLRGEAGSLLNLAPIGVGLVVLVGFGLLGWLLWTMSLPNATPAERVYAKMSRLGALAGTRRQSHQTPIEYAMALGNAIPAIASGALTVAWAFAAGRYSGRGPTEADLEDLVEDWKGVRGGLVARALRRLAPLPGA